MKDESEVIEALNLYYKEKVKDLDVKDKLIDGARILSLLAGDFCNEDDRVNIKKFFTMTGLSFTIPLEMMAKNNSKFIPLRDLNDDFVRKFTKVYAEIVAEDDEDAE